jgi:hypothetical protein
MPFYSYVCDSTVNLPLEHPGPAYVFTVFYKSFAEALPFIEHTKCDLCGWNATRVQEATLPAHLYGDPAGYDKPSPTKRFNTKTVSQKTGNNNSVG